LKPDHQGWIVLKGHEFEEHRRIRWMAEPMPRPINGQTFTEAERL
jgi:hypothetical protein